jgi:hypothetical protein
MSAESEYLCKGIKRMNLAVSLVAMFGKTVADKLLAGLQSKKDGAHKLELASNALAQGATAIDALKKTFGKEFLTTLNDAIGTTGNSRFSYEAGTQSYIKLDDGEDESHINVLRDELNINLDRMAALKTHSVDLRSQFRGLMSIWQARCLQRYGVDHGPDLRSTFQAIDQLLTGETHNYKQIYQLLSTTSLGGVGALLIIGGAITATGTGVGIVTSISLFVFGVPWLTVGALVLPGALLIALAARRSRPVDEINLSIAMAYKILERIEQGPQRSQTHQKE